jgi:hypothetical protein
LLPLPMLPPLPPLAAAAAPFFAPAAAAAFAGRDGASITASDGLARRRRGRGGGHHSVSGNCISLEDRRDMRLGSVSERSEARCGRRRPAATSRKKILRRKDSGVFNVGIH